MEMEMEWIALGDRNFLKFPEVMINIGDQLRHS